MTSLSPHEITVMFLSLGILLATARLFGEIAKRFNQPSVLGEILAGVVWGPTIVGMLAPQVNAFLFPQHGGGAVVWDGLMTLAITLFLAAGAYGLDRRLCRDHRPVRGRFCRGLVSPPSDGG